VGETQKEKIAELKFYYFSKVTILWGLHQGLCLSSRWYGAFKVIVEAQLKYKPRVGLTVEGMEKQKITIASYGYLRHHQVR
jgi:hypothetical protein